MKKIKETDGRISLLEKMLSEKIITLVRDTDEHICEAEELKEKVVELNASLLDLEKELASKVEAIAVNDMLHADFKELMKDKYLYDSDDVS